MDSQAVQAVLSFGEPTDETSGLRVWCYTCRLYSPHDICRRHLDCIHVEAGGSRDLWEAPHAS